MWLRGKVPAQQSIGSLFDHDIIVRYNDAYPKKRRVFTM